jgi:NAD(P)-dependent dehydrogenase (short-subunit alcohol dehydrogenase family)
LFGALPAVGKTVKLNGKSFIVVGVMAALAGKPLHGLIQRIQLQSAANGIKHVLLNARLRSVANPDRQCGVVFRLTPSQAQDDTVFAFLDATPDDWDRAWRVNVLSQVYGAEAAIPPMLERGRGYLLHTCSAAGLLTTPGDAPYTATKHAAVGFAEWLAVTYGGRGIGVSALCPQAVNTPLLQEPADAGNLSAMAVRSASAVLEPEDVAEAVCFFVSQRAAKTTGCILTVDGGLREAFPR